MGNFQNQSGQLHMILAQINQSLQELARGQHQMILMSSSQTPVPAMSEASAEQEWNSMELENPNIDPSA